MRNKSADTEQEQVFESGDIIDEVGFSKQPREPQVQESRSTRTASPRSTPTPSFPTRIDRQILRPVNERDPARANAQNSNSMSTFSSLQNSDVKNSNSMSTFSSFQNGRTSVSFHDTSHASFQDKQDVLDLNAAVDAHEAIVLEKTNASLLGTFLGADHHHQTHVQRGHPNGTSSEESSESEAPEEKKSARRSAAILPKRDSSFGAGSPKSRPLSPVTRIGSPSQMNRSLHMSLQQDRKDILEQEKRKEHDRKSKERSPRRLGTQRANSSANNSLKVLKSEHEKLDQKRREMEFEAAKQRVELEAEARKLEKNIAKMNKIMLFDQNFL